MTDQQLDLLKRGYFRRGENWSKLCRRVADAVASGETDKKKWSDAFYSIMHELYFLPNTPTLVNAGVTNNSLAACYVVDIGDSLNEIMNTATMVGKIQKFGGGTGLSYDPIRPTCMNVKSTGRPACGPIGAMRVVNTSSAVFEQGSKRNGANMAVLNVHHPDICSFIRCKRTEGILSNVNISVSMNEDFLTKKQDAVHEVWWGKNTKGYLDAEGNFTKHKNRKLMTVGDIIDMIVDGMYANGEPGIIFLDRMNNDNKIKNVKIVSTNPCGEVPLFAYESCNLGSINLYKFVKDGKIDYTGMSGVVRVATRFLDNIVDLNRMPDDLVIVSDTTKKYRKIGMGVMGFADTLYAMGIRYGSEDSVAVASDVMRSIKESVFEESKELAKEKGSFPEIKNSTYKDNKISVRNATLTTIAPTGSISIIAGVSAGIEPVFKRKMKVNTSDSNNGYVIESVGYHDYKDKYNSDVFVEANDVSIEEHLKIQSAFQQYTDNAVSKTINAPNNTTKEEIHSMLKSLYRKSIKGVTFYRDGSRSVQAVSGVGESAARGSRKARDSIEEGVTFKRDVACGTMYITINQDSSGRINEVFATLGKGGSCNYSFLESMNRVISVALQCGAPIEQMIKQMRGIRCSNIQPKFAKGGEYLSCSDAIAKTMIDRYEQLTNKRINTEDKDQIAQKCPDCNNIVVFTERCRKCMVCGWSLCG